MDELQPSVALHHSRSESSRVAVLKSVCSKLNLTGKIFLIVDSDGLDASLSFVFRERTEEKEAREGEAISRG